MHVQGMDVRRRRVGIRALARIAAALLLLSTCAAGCAVVDTVTSTVSSFFGDTEERTPAELMFEGEEYLEAGRYHAAAEGFQQIKDRYPYSKYALKAELLLADATFLRDDYNTAYELYDEFERLHPRNPNIPYVIFKKGECHLMQVSTVDRDQTHTRAAQEEYERLIRRFPSDRYAELARKKIRKCLIYRAEYELYVGHFYFGKGHYKAAMGRYQYIIRNYPDMGQYHEALEYIRICKSKLAEQEAERLEELKEEEQERAEKEAAKAAAEAMEAADGKEASGEEDSS